MGLAPLIFKIFQKFKKSRNLHICSFLKPYYIKKLTKIWVNNCTNSISLLSYLSIYLSIYPFLYLYIYLSIFLYYLSIPGSGIFLEANKKKFSQIGQAIMLCYGRLTHTTFSLLSKLWNILEKYSFDIIYYYIHYSNLE